MSTHLYTRSLDTPAYKGVLTVDTRLFINGVFVDPIAPSTIDVINPANGKIITAVSSASTADLDVAVEAALKAYKTTWGLKASGSERGRLLNKLADLLQQNLQEVAALEAYNAGKTFPMACMEVDHSVAALRYFAGWADKVQGKSIETSDKKLAYTRHEPFGVVGAITPWNLPLGMVIMKLAPALATGNVVILKPSEVTPLTALKLASLINEAGFPAGVVNVLNGFGSTIGAAIASHPKIAKVSFTGSTVVGRKILRASAEGNLKSVTLELGGKSPVIIFDDADLEQAVKWTALSNFYNAGQLCHAGTRIFVQEGVYDAFVAHFSGAAQYLTQSTGDPFALGTQHGPLVSQAQFDRVMSYIKSGKEEGAEVAVGGERHGSEGYFVQPTIFTNVKPDMKIVKEEIFGPVAVIMKFSSEEEVITAANDTTYGLSGNVFSQNITRALRVAHALEAGTALVNSAHGGDIGVPFGGYKQSGIGRELGEHALETYTQIKAVHVNLGVQL